MTVLVSRLISCRACDIALELNKRDVARFFVQAVQEPNCSHMFNCLFRVESYREYLRVAKAFRGEPATEEQFHSGDLG